MSWLYPKLQIMKLLLAFIPTLLLVNQCRPPEEKPYRNYTLVGDDVGIKVEQFDSTVTDDNRYNHNNKVFKVGREFIYAYTYKSASGEAFYFTRNEDGWEFVPAAESTNMTITSVMIGVLSGLKPMIDFIPDYNQTLLKYKMRSESSYETSGVIENEANTWMHPPREALFAILELNPFPYVKFPLMIGEQWKWELAIGSSWGDSRWRTWDGAIKNSYNYEITSQQEIETSLGKLSCFEIKSTATSELGETSLRAWFNENYGFVRLNYTNINGSTIDFELIELSE